MAIGGVLGAVVVGWLYASGGSRRSRQLERAREATPAGLRRAALAGLVLGALGGAFLARSSEKGTMS